MIDLSPAHAQTIKQIIAKILPNNEVIIFGSRINGTAKQYSDIDLAIISNDGVNKNKLWEVREAFTESDLPFLVDVLDWSKLSQSFQNSIAVSYERLWIWNLKFKYFNRTIHAIHSRHEARGFCAI